MATFSACWRETGVMEPTDAGPVPVFPRPESLRLRYTGGGWDVAGLGCSEICRLAGALGNNERRGGKGEERKGRGEERETHTQEMCQVMKYILYTCISTEVHVHVSAHDTWQLRSPGRGFGAMKVGKSLDWWGRGDEIQ